MGMTQPDLFTADLSAARPQGPLEMADTSMEAFERLLARMPDLDWHWLDQVYGYCTATGYDDCTAGELADWTGLEKTTVRPRLTMLKRKKLLEFTPSRQSRSDETIKVHPYKPTLPRSAVVRARAERQKHQQETTCTQQKGVLR